MPCSRIAPCNKSHLIFPSWSKHASAFCLNSSPPEMKREKIIQHERDGMRDTFQMFFFPTLQHIRRLFLFATSFADVVLILDFLLRDILFAEEIEDELSRWERRDRSWLEAFSTPPSKRSCFCFGVPSDRGFLSSCSCI